MDHSTPQPTPTLLRDQIIVSVAAIVWLVGTAMGFGLFGGESVQEQGEGLFSDSATLIAPHSPAFSIWSVIYLFLAAYVLWQWFARRSTWAAATRLPAAASLALNGIWLVVVFQGWITASVVVMVGIVAALGWLARRISTLAPEGWLPRLAVCLTFGLYLGWIAVATCANIALWLVDLGVPKEGLTAETITIAVLMAVVLIACWIEARTPHAFFRLGLVAASTWGLAWVGYGRLAGDLTSMIVALSAFGAAALALLGGAAVALRRKRVEG